MSIKINSSIDEVKKWVTEDSVCEILFAFGIIEDEYTYNKTDDFFLPLEKNRIKNSSSNDIKVNMSFEDYVDKDKSKNNSFSFVKLSLNGNLYSEAAA